MIIAINFPIQAIGKKKPEKSGLQWDSNPWPPRCRCAALPTELWSQTLGARSYFLRNEGGARICREAVLVNFWCHFEEILISTFSIAVSQNQVVCGVYMYICAVLQCCHPPYVPFRDDWLLTEFPWIFNIFNHIE